MNDVVLIGRLTKDPELRYTASQMPVCTFTLAVDRQVKKEGAPTADFIRITVFNKPAENCSRFLSKGREAAVQGYIQTGSYKDRDGKTVYTTDVIANRVEFIGGRGQAAEPAPAVKNDIPDGFEEIDESDVPF